MAAIEGKTCIITGATAGIGLAAAEKLAAMGARLLLVGRNPSKGEAALARLRAIRPGLEAQILYADLSRLSDLRELARSLLVAAPRIDVLMNNAGAVYRRREVTEDGLERTFALNHMAYFLLSRLLMERIVASAPARIVNVASSAHRGATLDFDDLQMARRFDGWTAYRRSKLCNILFTRALARRLEGTGVVANSVHPGFVASEFGNNNAGPFRWFLALAKRFMAISPAAGAETPVHVAAAPETATISGEYFERCRPAAPSPAARDDAAAARLWRESARIAGLPEE